ncbi:MAG TPA: tetratricopeptide repeat protein [Blastocatellia bacterium]|nr:tetratricopeptide repeat protein [Blastocatellia bacterium]
MFISLLIGSGSIRPARTAQVLSFQQDKAGAGAAAPTLDPGRSIEREISSGQSHSYRITLDAGMRLRVLVEQQGIDVSVGLLTPDGKALAESKSDNGNFGPEIVSMIAEEPIEVRLEVRPPDWEAPTGRYEVKIADLRMATERDRKQVDAERAFAEGMRLSKQGTAEGLRQSLAKFEAALQLYRSLSDRSGEAASFIKIGQVYSLTSETQKSLDAFNQALLFYQLLGDRGGEATALNNVCWARFQTGERQKALDCFDRALPLSRETSNRLAESLILRNLGSVYNSLAEKQKALEYFDQALRLNRMVGPRGGEGFILYYIAAVYNSIGEKQKALDHHYQALQIFRAVRNIRGEAEATNGIGMVYYSIGEKRKARDYLEKSLSLKRMIGDRKSEALTLNNLSLVYETMGEMQKALDHLQLALLINRDVGDRVGETVALNSLGNLYKSLGEEQKALDYFNQTLIVMRKANHREGEAATLNNIGAVHSALGEDQKALETYIQSLAIFREVNDRKGECASLNNLGLTYGQLRDYQKALEYFDQTLSLRSALNDLEGQAATLNNIGFARLSLGEPEAALDAYAQALRLSRAFGDTKREARALKGIAQAERDRGNLTEALDRIGDALKIVESLRTKIDVSDLRASYLGATRSYYEFCVDLLMRLHRLNPSKDYAVAAFQTSERSRARALIETLAEARAEIRNGVDPALLARERELQKRIESKTDHLIRSLGGKRDDEQAAAARKEIEGLEIEYQRLQSQIRAASPRYAALTRPQPLSLTEIQHQVVDDDALLLEYVLGDERSYLWAVTRTSIASHELPPRKEIERVASQVRDLLTARNRIVRFETVDERLARIAQADAEYPKTAAALSQMLLGPVSNQLEKRRLLIVGDGALQYVSFAALPLPASGRVGEWATGRVGDMETRRVGDGATSGAGVRRPVAPSPRRPVAYSPLIVAHEVVSSPSASTLAVLRRELTGRTPAPKTVAALADPVFDPGDERFKPSVVSRGTERAVVAQSRTESSLLESDLSRSARDLDLDDIRGVLPRLPYTRMEAQMILSLVPADQRFAALDFAANQTTATSDELARYRYVHFATHGLLNPKHPELSGIVLSLFNEQGAAQDGFLRASEVFNLNLPAEMVVLSGCQTALGKDIRGEGLVGLTRGFMYAGAARVLVSLWEVNDHATSELMGRLYRGILGKRRLTPAAALREAQVSLWREKRWGAPDYWAAFTLQGEPR